MSNLYLSVTSDRGKAAATKQGNYDMQGWVGGFEGVLWFNIYEPARDQRDALNFFGRFFIRIQIGQHPNWIGDPVKSSRVTLYDGPLSADMAKKFWNHPTNPHLVTEVITDWDATSDWEVVHGGVK